jgi:hypothetical protein
VQVTEFCWTITHDHGSIVHGLTVTARSAHVWSCWMMSTRARPLVMDMSLTSAHADTPRLDNCRHDVFNAACGMSEVDRHQL